MAVEEEDESDDADVEGAVSAFHARARELMAEDRAVLDALDR